MRERASISVGGAPFRRWSRIAVHAGVKHAARAFEITFPDTPGAPRWGVFSGQPQVVVTATGEVIFTGFSEAPKPKLTGKSLTVSVSGRAKGADVIDSTVDHTQPDYTMSNVLAVAQSQDRFGIGFTADFTPDGFDRWRPNPGDRLFHSLVPLAEEENATLSGQADGSIRITRAGESPGQQSGALEEGVNVWELEGEFDTSAQHSLINQHGQSYKGNGTQNIAIKASATNTNVVRFRPLDEHHDRHTDRDRLKRRAKRRRDKEQGEGIRASGQVRGWRDDGGALWKPGNLVFVKSPSLLLNQNMLIETVVYEQDGHAGDGGTRTQLHLVDPRAHGGSAPQVNKSGGAWQFDDSAAQ